jgi:hypothetical protein
MLDDARSRSSAFAPLPSMRSLVMTGGLVTVNEARGTGWTTLELSASEFLVAVFSGAIHPDLFPDDFPSDAPAFEAVTT